MAAANQPLKTLPTSQQPGQERVSHMACLAARSAAEDGLILDHVQSAVYQSPSAASAIDSGKDAGISARGTSTRRSRQMPALGL